MLRPLRVSQPTTVTEASAELARLGEEAKIYAGGTELILLLRLGLVHYTHLVDVKKIPALGELAWDGQTMHIGAAVTHRRLERSAEVATHLPLLQQAAALVANVRVRNVGTLGGNLCFGDPHSDPAPALLVYNTRVKIGQHGGALPTKGHHGDRDGPIDAAGDPNVGFLCHRRTGQAAQAEQEHSKLDGPEIQAARGRGERLFVRVGGGERGIELRI